VRVPSPPVIATTHGKTLPPSRKCGRCLLFTIPLQLPIGQWPDTTLLSSSSLLSTHFSRLLKTVLSLPTLLELLLLGFCSLRSLSLTSHQLRCRHLFKMQSSKLASILIAAVSLVLAQGKSFEPVPLLLILSNIAPDNSIKTLTTVIVQDIVPAIYTSTQYATNIVTVLGCPPGELNCPVRHSVAIVTATLAFSTTVCPLTMTSQHLSQFETTVLSTIAPLTTEPFSTTTSTWSGTVTLGSTSASGNYEIPSSVWSSVFPNGLPTFSSASNSPEDLNNSPLPSNIISLSSDLSFSTSVSIHDSISTLSNGPPGQTPSPSQTLSLGSFTVIVQTNTTSILPAYFPYPIGNATQLPLNATFHATGTFNSSMPAQYSSGGGSGSTTNLFGICMALLVIALVS
jgi:hypothetical protein